MPARLIALGDADVMVAGGTESPINRLSMAGFAACRALSTGFNDDAGEGLAALRQGSRRLRHGRGRRRRGARGIRARQARAARRSTPKLIGYGLSGDAYHITAPAEDGDGAFRCMSAAIKRAGITPAEIDYINAHGTSTMADEIELGAVERVLGNAAAQGFDVVDQIVASGICSARPGRSRRSSRILAIRDGVAPPTINLDNPSVETRDRSRAAHGAQARHQCGAVEFVRLRRHQRVAGLPPRGQLALVTVPIGSTVLPYSAT